MPTPSWISLAMAEKIVVNTGPLVSLARADLMDVVGRLPYEFICPKEVSQEIAAGILKGYPIAEPEWLTPTTLSAPLDPVATASLDMGEAAVIQLAKEQGISRVCIDERKGRRAALAVGLKVTGTLGLLSRAKTLGLVPTLGPLVAKLQRAGAYVDAELVRRVLAGVGE